MNPQVFGLYCLWPGRGNFPLCKSLSAYRSIVPVDIDPFGNMKVGRPVIRLLNGEIPIFKTIGLILISEL